MQNGGSKKPPLREKISLIYEELFSGNDLSLKNVGFWDEFFLLWAHPNRIQQSLRNIPGDGVVKIKEILLKLSSKCIETICDEQNIRAVNAFRTLMGLIWGISNRADLGSKYDAVCLLFAYDKLESKFKQLIDRICVVLCDAEVATTLKILSVNLLLCFVTCMENMHENVWVELLLVDSVFESFSLLLANPSLRNILGKDAALFIALILNYNKYEGVNPYVVKLSILDDELVLNGYSCVISGVLSLYNIGCRQTIDATKPQGIFSGLTSMVGNMFVGDEGDLTNLEPCNYDEGLLLALYEAVHLNRNFITTLTNLPTGDSPELSNQSSLLVSFLTYSSVLMQDLKNERSRNAAKLCAIIMTCITEDQYANSLMHDVNMACRVPLFRAKMRHRRGEFEVEAALRPLAATMLDLCHEFIVSHLIRKHMPHQLYFWKIGIVHRILCYQKKCGVRLNYEWRKLWNALGTLLQFLVTNESHLLEQFDVFLLCSKVVTVFNVFITFGDTFLPNPTTYDMLYYELVRQADAFHNLYSMVLRHISCESCHKESAVKLGNQLVNVRCLITHFTPKIQQLGVGGVTEQEVLQVVRSHYDTLTLKLYDNLDVYERYNEKNKEKIFMSQMVKMLVRETKDRLLNFKLDHQSVLSQLSTIK